MKQITEIEMNKMNYDVFIKYLKTFNIKKRIDNIIDSYENEEFDITDIIVEDEELVNLYTTALNIEKKYNKYFYAETIEDEINSAINSSMYLQYIDH